MAGLLLDPYRAEDIGRAARRRVRDHFLGPDHLGRYSELIEKLMAERGELQTVG